MSQAAVLTIDGPVSSAAADEPVKERIEVVVNDDKRRLFASVGASTCFVMAFKLPNHLPNHFGLFVPLRITILLFLKTPKTL